MASILKFELDIDPSILRVAEYYGSETYTIVGLLNNSKFELSKVGTNHFGGKVDPNIRKSKSMRVGSIFYAQHPANEIKKVDSSRYSHDYNFYDYQHISSAVEKNIGQLVPKKFRHCIRKGISKSKYNSSISNIHQITAIKYTEGDFFSKHSDSIKDAYHFATVIIMIPPFCKELEHVGGILRVWNQDNKLHEFDSSKIDKITVIAFNPTFEHECTPIISGTRLIFKTDWTFDKYIFDLALSLSNTSLNIIEELKVDDGELTEKIVKIKEELNKKMDQVISQGVNNQFLNVEKEMNLILTKLRELDDEKPKISHYKIDNIIDFLKSQINKKVYAIIPLINYYPLEEVQFMYQNELVLYQALNKVFGKVGIKNIKKKIRYDTDNFEPDMPFIQKEYDDGKKYGKLVKYMENTDASNYTLVIDTDSFLDDDYNKLGKTVIKSKYNDSTYDSIHNISYTCFIVKLINMESIYTFLNIWSRRKDDCPYIGNLPKDVMKMIISFI